ncbi:MAG: DUF433 domain-containing protein [Thermoanaerobaculia bacterium]
MTLQERSCSIEKEVLHLSDRKDRTGLDERPRYILAQAARYVHISPTTLRSWVVGRTYQTASGSRYFRPLIARPVPEDARLSFPNLIEAHVLRALRVRHEVPMSALRTALDYAESECNIKRLLLHSDLRTGAGTVFIERLGQIIDLGRSGQIVLKELLNAHLNRIDRNLEGLPLRLFPVITARGVDGPRIVAVDPKIAFGRPIISGKGVRTLTIVERLDAGEERSAIAADYGLEEREIDEAILYESAA